MRHAADALPPSQPRERRRRCPQPRRITSCQFSRQPCTPSRTPSRGESPSPHRPPPPGSLVHPYPAGGLALLAPAGLAAAAALRPASRAATSRTPSAARAPDNRAGRRASGVPPGEGCMCRRPDAARRITPVNGRERQQPAPQSCPDRRERASPRSRTDHTASAASGRRVPCRICVVDRWRVCRNRAAQNGRFWALLTGHAIDCRLLLGAGQPEFGGAWVVGRYPGGCRGRLWRVAPVPADGGFFGDVE